jgi:hypothetical protein
MPNPILDHDWLDDQCQLYEGNWTIDSSGPAAVIAFALELLAPTDSRLQALLESLIEVDVERVWMQWRSKVTKQTQDYTASEWYEQLLVVPKLVDYVAAISQQRIEFSVAEPLLRAEYRARQEWGDAPRWETVAAPWPNLTTLSPKPGRHRVELQSKEFPEPKAFDLCGLTEFGRQRTTDELFGVLVHDSQGSRLIVAPRADAKISRRQFGVQILSANHAILTNLSQINPLPIDATTTLGFEHKSVIRLPFSLRFQDLSLRFT